MLLNERRLLEAHELFPKSLRLPEMKQRILERSMCGAKELSLRDVRAGTSPCSLGATGQASLLSFVRWKRRMHRRNRAPSEARPAIS